MSKIRQLAVAVGSALALGATSQAFAAPVFTIDPTGYWAGGVEFSADQAGGTSTARVVALGGGMYESNGFITITSFSLNSSPVNAFTHGAGGAYGLYATFSQTFNCGGALGVGVECAVTGLNLSVFADPGFANTYQQSTLAADPFVTDVGMNDVLLATSNFIFAGVAGLNAQGGAYQNMTSNFLLTAAGEDFFVGPNPFYEFVFSAFNNTAQGIQCDTGAGCPGDVSIVSITQEVGTIDFISQPVPEPGTLALLGLAFTGLSLVRRRNG